MPMRGVVTITLGGGVPSSTRRMSPPAHRSTPVCDQVEGERLAQLAGTVREVGGATMPPLGHQLNAPQRRQRPQQDRLAVAVGTGDDVGAVVHPVAEVHVEVPGRPEHDLGARRRAAERVGGRLVGAVRLDLDDAPGARPADQHLAQQLGRNDERIPGEEVTLDVALSHRAGSPGERLALAAQRLAVADDLVGDRARAAATR